MWNEPSEKELRAMPPLYSSESVPLQDKIVRMHFFLGGCDWYAVEDSPEEHVFFGSAILNGDLENSEWGYFSVDELREVSVRGIEIDRDLH